MLLRATRHARRLSAPLMESVSHGKTGETVRRLSAARSLRFDSRSQCTKLVTGSVIQCRQVHTNASPTFDAVRKLLNERASIREYTDSPIPDEVVAELLRLTQRAPTGFNTQPYVAIIARSEEDRARVATAMMDSNKAKVIGAPLVVAFAADLEPSKNVPRLQELMRAGGAPEPVVNFLPLYVKTSSGEGSDHGAIAWSYKQTSIAAATFLYAAAAKGLATCPMEGFDQEAIKKALGLSDRYSVPIVISVGYAKEGAATRVSGRRPPTEVFFEGQLGGSTAALFE